MARLDRLDLRGRTATLVRDGARRAAGGFRALGSTLGSAAGTGRPPTPPGTGAGTTGVDPDGATAAAATARLAELLDAAATQDERAGRAALLHRAVGQLVPDEARILTTLARAAEHDPGSPLVHIHCLTSTGLAGEPVLVNASLVGRSSGVALPGLTPHYVTRLLDLGLVEVGPEDARLHDDYQALLADPAVLAAVSRARADGSAPRVLRHTLRLSSLGRELCAGLPGS